MLTKVFAGASALAGFAGGTAAAFLGDLPMTVAFAAAAGAAGASYIATNLAMAFDGKGPEAGVLGMATVAAGHVVGVPVGAIAMAQLVV